MKGQDIHFSSIGFNPMFFNPAMSGFMNSRFRVSTIYRNQWQTVSKGYNTWFASFELQPWIDRDNSHGFGLGIGLTSDVAGSLSFGEKDIAISGAYFFALDKKNENYISFGVEAIRKNWSMNLTNAEFNRERLYDDDICYQDLNTTDISLGIAFQQSKDENHLLSIGLALFHINEPSYSRFANKEDSYIYRRLYANISYMMPTAMEGLNINPQIIFQQQHNFNELLVGTDCLIDLDKAIFTKKIFSFGLYLRNLDAIALTPKFRYNDFLAGLAYDVNISKLNKVSYTYGAVELWLSYSFSGFNYNKQITKIPCPIF